MSSSPDNSPDSASSHAHEKFWRFEAHPVVFTVSAAIILGFVVAGAVAPAALDGAFVAIRDRITDYFGWLYLLSVNFFLLFCLYLGFGRYGRVRLSADGSGPEFSNFGWLAMLFGAGMGIGLLFFGVAEPIMHFTAPPFGAGGTPEAAREAMSITFFHWGLHAWAVYTVVALGLAFFHYRRGLPLTARSMLAPVLGRYIDGWPGWIVDILAVVATMFGVATSLGFGAMQINAGLNYSLGVPNTLGIQLALIAVITVLATIAVASGIKRGILWMSEMDMIVGLGLMAFVFVAGPSMLITCALGENLATYTWRLPQYSLVLGSSDASFQRWLGKWTIFYWAWWIAWSPFVGIFIARISRGRTVREIVLGCLLAPTLLTFLWLTVLGNAALYENSRGVEGGTEAGAIAKAAHGNIETALFVLLERYPVARWTAIITVISICLFFITSADSASLVIDMVTAGGKTDGPVVQRIFWGLAQGVVAAVLLVAGGLDGLGTATLTAALPLCVIMWLICFCLVRGLKQEPR